MSTPPKPVDELPLQVQIAKKELELFEHRYKLTERQCKELDDIFSVFLAAINQLYISREAHQAELLKARINELDEHIGIYNRLFEPNGEFRNFGSLKPIDVANLYHRIGERIRELEAELRDKFKLGDE